MDLKNKTFLIVGLARDCEDALAKSVEVLTNAFSFARILNFLIVESDSSDQTESVLKNLASNNQNFNYVSLGDLQRLYSKRTERIAFCRNHYLTLINESPEYRGVDYVVVADMDGVNERLCSNSVTSCWVRSDWDVCTANQNGPYYDIWALRHPIWAPNDCWQQADFLFSIGLSRFKSIFSSTYSRMIKISPQAEWIPVDSSFGGLAIYRKEILRSVRYAGLTEKSEQVCEHVSLHKEIRQNGGRILINPAMINANVVEHAKNATQVGLIKFWIRCQLHSIIDAVGLLPLLKRVFHVWSLGKRID